MPETMMDIRVSTKSAVGGLDEAACWDAVARRDRTADGTFLFGVITTLIFCRPGCPARRPKRENARFFRDAASARRAGFRPCKRCEPEALPGFSVQARLVREICRAIDERGELPSLADIAGHFGLGAAQVVRIFRQSVGVTPKAYLAGRRGDRVRSGLAQSETVTRAVYEAGYGSSSRFYEQAGDVLGMTPRAYRAGGDGHVIRYMVETCWLGLVLIAATERGVCAILFGDDEDGLIGDLRKRFHRADVRPADDRFSKQVSDVLAAIEQPELAVHLPLDIQSTAFQQRVWTALRAIPAGRTASYREVAETIGAPKAVRAVARACASNPVAVAVPCHRVVRSDGKLAGYRWGVERKRKLLAKEAGRQGD